MAHVDSGPVDATDKFRDTPKSKWRDLVRAKRSFLAVKINYDCRCLVDFVSEAETVWEELGFASSEEMIRNGYKLDPVEIELAVAWLKHNATSEEIGLDAVKAKADSIRELRQAHPDWTQQQIADEVGCSKQYVSEVSSKSLDSKETVDPPEHLTATDSKADFRKLPAELQEAVRAKHISLNAAAIQAGVRHKPSKAEICVKAFRASENRLEPLRQIVKTLDDHERAVLLEWLTNGV